MKNFAFLAFAAVIAAGCCSSKKPCVGDCNDDGKVVAAEVILAGEIAASNEPLAKCKAADQDGDGTVTADEVSAASNASVNGCK